MAIAFEFGIEISEPGIAHCSILLDGDVYDQAQILDKVSKGKHHMYRFDVNPRGKKTIGDVIYYTPIDLASFRAKNKTIRQILAEKKAIDKANKKEDRKAETKTTLKDKK